MALLKKLPLWIYFILAAFFLFFGTAFFPLFKIWPFAPFLAILFYRVNFSQALWISFFCGLAMDVLSSQFKFGLIALTHTITGLLLYGQKKHFFEEKAIALSLYSVLISGFLSLFLLVFSSLSEKQIAITLPMLFSNLIVMPFLDGIYTFIGFALPTSLYFTIKRSILRRQLDSEESSSK